MSCNVSAEGSVFHIIPSNWASVCWTSGGVDLCPPAQQPCVLWSSGISRGYTLKPHPLGDEETEWLASVSWRYWLAYLKATIEESSEKQSCSGSHSGSGQLRELWRCVRLIPCVCVCVDMCGSFLMNIDWAAVEVCIGQRGNCTSLVLHSFLNILCKGNRPLPKQKSDKLSLYAGL